MFIVVCDACSKTEELLMMGADPNFLTTGDVSAIHLAAGVEDCSEHFTRLLLLFGADPNVT